MPARFLSLSLSSPPQEPRSSSPSRWVPRSGSNRSSAATVRACLRRGLESACNGFRSLKFADVRGTLAEMEEVRRLWREKKGGGKVDELKGGLATESALKERARGKAVIHFATHGFFLNDRCRSSFQSDRGVGLPEGASKAD